MSTAVFKFGLGDELKDKVTGMKGVVVARIQYLNGCIQYAVKPQKLKDGCASDATYFDESQLDLIKANRVTVELSPTQTVLKKQQAGPSTFKTPRM